METNALESQTLLKGLIVLTAIPVVGMALWAEYFWKNIAVLKETPAEYEPAEEIQKVRLAGLTALLLQLFVFLGSSEARKDYPLATTLLFAAAIWTHIWQQSSMERRMTAELGDEKIQTSPLEQGLNTFLWVAIPGFLYVGILLLTVCAFIAIAHFNRLSAPWGILLTLIGLVLGVLGGLGASFALGPQQVRRILPCSPLPESKTREEIEACFKAHQMTVPLIWVVDSVDLHSNNVMITGFQQGRGIFHPALFISKPILTALEPQEIRAIILHEISHLRLQHLRNRFTLASGLIIASSILSGGSVLFCHLLAPTAGLSAWAGVISLIFCFMHSFKIIERQSNLHEIEADIHAVKAGATIEELGGALRKLDKLNLTQNEKSRSQKTAQTHPQTEERIEILQTYFAKKETFPSESAEETQSTQKAA